MIRTCYNDAIGNAEFPIDQRGVTMRTKSLDTMSAIVKYSEQFYLENGRSPYKSEIAEEIGISKGTVAKYLAAMRDRGMIEYDGYTIHTDVTRKYNGNTSGAAILDSSVSCGPLQLEEERVLEYVHLPEAIFGSGDFFILRANGDSMVDAGIDDGDWIVIKKQNTAEEGDIIVALSEGLNNLKYFYTNKRKGCAILRSANEAKHYKDIEVYDLRIQGVAQHVIKGL